MSNTKIYDAIVIGSGITGGWAAKEVTERGLDVLQLEAGRNIDPRTDYAEHKLPYELKFRGMGDRRFIEENHPIQKECYACTEYSHHFFVKDKEERSSTPTDKPYLYSRGRRRTLHYVGAPNPSLERPGFSCQRKRRDRNPWPVSCEDVEPWYNYVEELISVSGAKEGLFAAAGREVSSAHGDELW